MTGVNEHAAIITSQTQRIAALERAAARRDHIDAINASLTSLDGRLDTAEADIAALETLTATTAWTALPTYGAQWSNYGGDWQVGQYRKVGDEVQVRGLLKRSGGTGSSATICTLPTGFRPPDNVLFGCQGYVFGANGLIRVSIYDTGALLLDDTNNQYYTSSPYYAGIGTNAIDYIDLSVIRFSTST